MFTTHYIDYTCLIAGKAFNYINCIKSLSLNKRLVSVKRQEESKVFIIIIIIIVLVQFSKPREREREPLKLQRTSKEHYNDQLVFAHQAQISKKFT